MRLLNIFTVPTEIYRGTSYDKCTYCKSLWIKASAKHPECKRKRNGRRESSRPYYQGPPAVHHGRVQTLHDKVTGLSGRLITFGPWPLCSHHLVRTQRSQWTTLKADIPGVNRPPIELQGQDGSWEFLLELMRGLRRVFVVQDTQRKYTT